MENIDITKDQNKVKNNNRSKSSQPIAKKMDSNLEDPKKATSLVNSWFYCWLKKDLD